MPKVVQPQFRRDRHPVHITAQIPGSDQSSPGRGQHPVPGRLARYVLLEVPQHGCRHGDESCLVVLHVLLNMPLRVRAQHAADW